MVSTTNLFDILVCNSISVMFYCIIIQLMCDSMYRLCNVLSRPRLAIRILWYIVGMN